MFWQVTLPQIAADHRRRGHHADRHGDEGLRHRQGDDERQLRHPDVSPTTCSSGRSATANSALGVGARHVLFVGVLPVMIVQHPPHAAGEGLTMTLTTLPDPAHERASATGAVYRFLRNIPTWVLWMLVADLADRPRSGCSSTRSAARTCSATAAGGRCSLGNFDQLTLQNYKAVLSSSVNGST